MLYKRSQNGAGNGANQSYANNLNEVNEKSLVGFHTQTAHNCDGSNFSAHVNMYSTGHAHTAQQQRDETHQGQEIG